MPRPTGAAHLDIQPTKLHQRVPVVLGLKNEVERVTATISRLITRRWRVSGIRLLPSVSCLACWPLVYCAGRCSHRRGWTSRRRPSVRPLLLKHLGFSAQPAWARCRGGWRCCGGRARNRRHPRHRRYFKPVGRGRETGRRRLRRCRQAGPAHHHRRRRESRRFQRCGRPGETALDALRAPGHLPVGQPFPAADWTRQAATPRRPQPARLRRGSHHRPARP